jgi:pimeloyl-ACP methyl ester carboxylesterase
MKALFDRDQPLRLADQGCFFVAGTYTTSADGTAMSGQMYVQYQIPAELRSPYPLVLLHGGRQTGVNFLSTPDGRRGWADYFLAAGRAVYVADLPGSGRVAYLPSFYGEPRSPQVEDIRRRFTGTAGGWPRSDRHSQWPGTGEPGDAVFDQFTASQVEGIADLDLLERLSRGAGCALLDRIGPAVLLTHSRSGPAGWGIADARPGLVKGIVAVEPNGPPWRDLEWCGPPQYFSYGEIGRRWGVAREPLRYEPAAPHGEEMRFALQSEPDAPGLVRCWLQAEPARQLVNLRGTPILILVGEASYQAAYCHCTAKFLEQAGVANTFVRLEEAGIRGNGHMMMLELNNLDIAAYIDDWLRRCVL